MGGGREGGKSYHLKRGDSVILSEFEEELTGKKVFGQGRSGGRRSLTQGKKRIGLKEVGPGESTERRRLQKILSDGLESCIKLEKDTGSNRAGKTHSREAIVENPDQGGHQSCMCQIPRSQKERLTSATRRKVSTGNRICP